MISKNLEVLRKYWIGKKVISISNEFQSDPKSESIKIGHVQEVLPITKGTDPAPIVAFEN